MQFNIVFRTSVKIKNSRLPARHFSKSLIETLRVWNHPNRSFGDDITLVVIDVL